MTEATRVLEGSSPWARNFGSIASGLGDIGNLYGAWQGAKAAKDAQKQAKQSSMFTQAFDVANLSQALQSQGAINQFMGGTGQDDRYQLSSYLSPDVQNKYMAQGMFGGGQPQQQLPQGAPAYQPFGGAPVQGNIPQMGGGYGGQSPQMAQLPQGNIQEGNNAYGGFA